MTARGITLSLAHRIILALTAIGALVPITPPPAVGQPGAPQFIQVRLDGVTPDVVTTSSEPTVTVTATVTNVGDRPVRDVVARLEHAPAVMSSAGLRSSLGADGADFQPVGDFTGVTTELGQGQTAGIQFTVPLRPGLQPALDINAPGVYPLLINVNGTPDYGAPALLDERRFLLPVTGVPADPDAGNQLVDAVAPDTTKPVPITLLWPLADRPRLAPGQPGGTNPVRLLNDDLAVSLNPGGRLDTLLAAAEFATSPEGVDPAGSVGGGSGTRGTTPLAEPAGIDQALCLAIDPDLLVTVNAMTAGYSVDDASGNSGTASRPGTGQAAAVAWLDRLRGLARRLCVTATPYAQADLDALDRVGDPVLSAAATRSGADIVDRILGVASLRGATVLGDGPLTNAGLALLDSQGGTVVIAAANDLGPQHLSPTVALAPFDPSVGSALAAVGTDPVVPGYLDSAASVPIGQDSPVARRQDAVAAVLWRLLSPDAEPRTQLLVPPAKWSPQPDDARLLLTTLANSLRSGLATARPLPAVLAETAAIPLDPQPESVPTEENGGFDDDVVAAIAGDLDRLQGLEVALTTDTRTGLTGPQYTAPLREDMLRALSQTEPASVRNELARQRVAVVGKTVGDLFGAVTIVNPGDSYTLATERSALPLALRNDLAVPIRVKLQVDAPPGMAVTDIGVQEVPPGYLPLRVPVAVHVSQRVAVDVTLRTAEGVQLGEPVRLSVHSNAYGKVLFAITLTGGLVLSLLVGRRLYHRFRGQPDRADLDRPDDRHRADLDRPDDRRPHPHRNGDPR